jgi:RNA polymerase sigma-70 factor (ECF subfamily)
MPIRDDPDRNLPASAFFVISRDVPSIDERMPSAAMTVGEASASAPLADAASARIRLERMFRAHHELIWRTLRRLGLSADLAADTTQQAYLIAAERLSDIRSGCERAFLFSTAIGLSRTNFRRSQRCQLESDMDLHVDPALRSEEMTNRCSAMELMDRVFVNTDPDLVTVFVLFELEGLSAPEIAQLVNIPIGTVASRLRRARATFRAAARRMEIAQPGELKS